MVQKRIIIGLSLLLITVFSIVTISSVKHLSPKVNNTNSSSEIIKETKQDEYNRENSYNTSENENNINSRQKKTQISSENNETIDDIKNYDKTITILLCGVDNGSVLTDVIVLGQYNVTKNSAVFIQIPRDSFVGNLTPTGKINGVLALRKDRVQGINLLKSTIENMLKIDIDYVASINLTVFRKCVDLIGGVEFDVPFYIDYLPDKVLYEGYQTLNGEQAEWLIRFRQGYPTGDIGRLQMQKKFLIALLSKFKQTDTFTLIKILKVIYDNIETDFPFADAIEYIPKLSQIQFSDINIITLPGNGKMYGKSAVYELNKEKVYEILKENIIYKNKLNNKNELSIEQI